MAQVAELAIRALRRSGLEMGPGYTYRELDDIQTEYGFTFHRDHADVLREVAPDGCIDSLGDPRMCAVRSTGRSRASSST